MSVIFIILPLAIVMAAIAVAAFRWAVRGGQYDDLETPAFRAIYDDEVPIKHPARAAKAAER